MALLRLLSALSDGIVRIERAVLIGLVMAVALLVLCNAVARLFGVTLAWADELAVLAMAWSGFFGASLMLRARIDPAVRLLHEVLGPGMVRVLRAAISAIAALFGALLLWMCWGWFNLPGLAAAGFDVAAFEAATFNFLYSTLTPVLVWPFFWFYLVVPWFALAITVHALTNLAEDLGALPQRALAQELGMAGETAPRSGGGR